MSELRSTTIATVAASVIATFVSAAINSAWLDEPAPRVETKTVIREVVKNPVNRPGVWASLPQEAIDGLSANLAHRPKQHVVIYCGGANCQELALDLENAFETAHWVADFLVPVIERIPTGVLCSDPELARLIAELTGLPVASMPEWDSPDKIAILIGRRPRD